MPRTAAAPYVLAQAGHRCTAGETRVRPVRTWAGQTAEEKRDAVLTTIGQQAGFEVLETRGSDWLDFQTVSARQIKAALEAAYAAGLAAAGR